MRNSHTSFSYVYRLISLSHPDQCYTGLTDNLKTRLHAHNSGQCRHTNKFKPWRLETAVCFSSRDKAACFENYLKTGSGRAFAKRHF